MTRENVPWVVFVTAVLSCSETPTVTLPPHDSAASVLFLVEQDTGVVTAFASDLDSKTPLQRSLQDPLSFTVVFLERELYTLGLTRGEISDTEGGRSLDALPVVQVFRTITMDPPSWQQLTAPSENDTFNHFRVPAFPPDACAASEGCHHDDPNQCIIPCRPSFTRAEPAFGSEPNLPVWVCAPGWREVVVSTRGLNAPSHAIRLCEPIAIDHRSCAAWMTARCMSSRATSQTPRPQRCILTEARSRWTRSWCRARNPSYRPPSRVRSCRI